MAIYFDVLHLVSRHCVLFSAQPSITLKGVTLQSIDLRTKTGKFTSLQDGLPSGFLSLNIWHHEQPKFGDCVIMAGTRHGQPDKADLYRISRAPQSAVVGPSGVNFWIDGTMAYVKTFDSLPLNPDPKNSDVGTGLIELITTKIFKELDSSRRSGYPPSTSDLYESLLAVSGTHGLQSFAISVLRRVLEVQDWRMVIQEPVARKYDYRRRVTDSAWQQAFEIASIRLLIAEMLMESGQAQATEFALECTAIGRDFCLWDMSGRYSSSLKGDLLILKARGCIKEGNTTEATNLLEEALPIVSQYQPANSASLIAYLHLCELALDEGNDPDVRRFVPILKIATTSEVDAFHLPVSLWSRCYSTLLRLLRIDGVTDCKTEESILSSWRKRLDKADSVLKKSCDMREEVGYFFDESMHAQASGDAFINAGSYAKARHAFKKAVRLAGKAKFCEPLFLAQCQAGIAAALDGSRLFALGERRWRLAIQIAGTSVEERNSAFFCRLLRSLSMTLQCMNRFIEAISLDREADRYNEEAGSIPTVIEDWNGNASDNKTPLLFNY